MNGWLSNGMMDNSMVSNVLPQVQYLQNRPEIQVTPLVQYHLFHLPYQEARQVLEGPIQIKYKSQYSIYLKKYYKDIYFSEFSCTYILNNLNIKDKMFIKLILRFSHTVQNYAGAFEDAKLYMVH